MAIIRTQLPQKGDIVLFYSHAIDAVKAALGGHPTYCALGDNIIKELAEGYWKIIDDAPAGERGSRVSCITLEICLTYKHYGYRKGTGLTLAPSGPPGSRAAYYSTRVVTPIVHINQLTNWVVCKAAIADWFNYPEPPRPEERV